jgi:hypothetical protein
MSFLDRLRQVPRSWYVVAALLVGFLGWRWWDEAQLWNAARQHFLGPLQIAENGRLEAIILACEAVAREEGYPLEGRWDFPSLFRGNDSLTPGPLLEWERLYNFKLLIALLDSRQSVELGCVWDPERHAAEVFIPGLP